MLPSASAGAPSKKIAKVSEWCDNNPKIVYLHNFSDPDVTPPVSTKPTVLADIYPI